MATIDERVVSMKFDGDQFQNGVKGSISALDRLKQALSLGGAKNGMADVQKSVDNFNTSGMEGKVSAVGSSFTAMQAIAFGALASIGAKAVEVGATITKALTIEGALDGFREYELQLGSVQTILANTQSKGSTLQDVNNTLDTLNKYSDETIYNFGEMARNIGTFTAAGVGLDTSAKAIKGIANLAAMSGSNSQQASTAMYQLSQAIAANKVGLMDWNSVVNAGMGGQVFQEALFNTAKTMGTLKNIPMDQTFEQWTKAGNSFRDSLQEGWITGEVLTSTLENFTGDLDEAALKQKGYSDQQVKDIMKMAETAKGAATEVKTFTGLIDTLKEGIGSGWAQTWETVIGDFEQAKKLWTGVSNFLGKVVNDQAEARNKLAEGWAKAGGRDKLIEGLGNAFKGLLSVINPIKDAFRDIFPPTTVAQLLSATNAFTEFTKKLTVSSETADKIKRTFKGVFAVLGIGVDIVMGIAKGFAAMFGGMADGAGGFLDLTAKIGDFLVKLREGIHDSEAFGNIFGVIGRSIGGFGKFIGEAARGISSLIGKIGELNVLEHIKNIFSGFGDVIKGMNLDSLNFDHILGAAGLGGVAFFAVKAKNALTDLFDNISSGGGIFDSLKEIGGNIGDAISSLTEQLELMQTNVKSDILLKIASAVGILAASLKILSTLKPEELAVGLGGITVLLGELIGGLMLLTKVTSLKGLVQVPMIAAALTLLATSLLILSVAVKNLSSLSWNELAVGLAGIGGGLAILVGATKLMGDGKGLITTAFAMTGMATALLILSAAVRSFASMSWDELGRGLAGVAGGLGLMVVALQLMPKNLLAQGAGLMMVGVSLNMLASAVNAMGSMSWEEIGRGLVALGGSLAILAIGLNAMNGTLAGSAAMMVAAAAIAVLTPPLIALSTLSWEGIAKGLLALGGAIAVFGVAAAVLSPILPAMLGLGAAIGLLGVGVGAAAAGIAMLATAITAMAAQGPLIISFITQMAAQLPALMATLATSLTAFITSFVTTLAGQITQISSALLQIFTTLGSTILSAITTLLPQIGQMFTVLGMTILQSLEALIPQMIETGTEIILALLQGLQQLAPEISNTMLVLLQSMLDTLVGAHGMFIDAGVQLILNIINGISSMIGGIVDAAFNLMISFLDAIAQKIPELHAKGIEMVHQLADAVRSGGPEAGAAAADLGLAIIQGIAGAIRSGLSTVISAATDMAKSALNAAKNFLGIHSPSREFAEVGKNVDLGMEKGIEDNADKPVSAIERLTKKVLDTASMVNDVFSKGDFNGKGPFEEDSAVVDFLFDLRDQAKDGGKGLMNGLKVGMERYKGEPIAVAKKVVGDIGDTFLMAKDVLLKGDFNGKGIYEEDSAFVNSLFNTREAGLQIARNLTDGLKEGVERYKGNPIKAIKNFAEDVRGGFEMVKNIFTKGDFNGNGPWDEDSKVVDGLFKVREAWVSLKGPITDVTKLTSVATEVFNAFKDDIIAASKEMAQKMAENFKQAVQGIKETLGQVKDVIGIADGLLDIVDVFDSTAKRVTRTIGNKFEPTWRRGKDVGKRIGNGINEGLASTQGDTSNISARMIDQTVAAAEDALYGQGNVNKFERVGQNATDGYKKGISGIETAYDGMTAKTKKRLFKETLDEWIGKIDKLLGGIDKVERGITAATSLFAKFGGGMQALLPHIGNLAAAIPGLSGIISGLGGSLTALLPALTGPIGGIIAVISGLLLFSPKARELLKGVFEFGKNIIRGIIDGIKSLVGGLISTVKNVIGGIFGAIGGFFKKVGDFFGGLFGRKKKKEPTLVDQVGDSVDEMKNKVVEAAKTINDAISGINNPTIKPVVDLSNIKQASMLIKDDLNNSIDMDKSLLEANAIAQERFKTGEYQNQVESGNSQAQIVYNQYNNSPKALSSIEIYRQTKNQLRLSGEV